MHHVLAAALAAASIAAASSTPAGNAAPSVHARAHPFTLGDAAAALSRPATAAHVRHEVGACRWMSPRVAACRVVIGPLDPVNGGPALTYVGVGVVRRMRSGTLAVRFGHWTLVTGPATAGPAPLVR